MDFPDNRFSGLIPATFSAVVNSSCPLLGFIGRLSPVTGAASAAAIIIVTVALPGLLYLKNNKNKIPDERHNNRGESTHAPTFDPLLNGTIIYAFIEINFFNFGCDVLGFAQKLCFSYDQHVRSHQGSGCRIWHCYFTDPKEEGSHFHIIYWSYCLML